MIHFFVPLLGHESLVPDRILNRHLTFRVKWIIAYIFFSFSLSRDSCCGSFLFHFLSWNLPNFSLTLSRCWSTHSWSTWIFFFSVILFVVYKEFLFPCILHRMSGVECIEWAFLAFVVVVVIVNNFVSGSPEFAGTGTWFSYPLVSKITESYPFPFIADEGIK